MPVSPTSAAEVHACPSLGGQHADGRRRPRVRLPRERAIPLVPPANQVGERVVRSSVPDARHAGNRGRRLAPAEGPIASAADNRRLIMSNVPHQNRCGGFPPPLPAAAADPWYRGPDSHVRFCHSTTMIGGHQAAILTRAPWRGSIVRQQTAARSEWSRLFRFRPQVNREAT